MELPRSRTTDHRKRQETMPLTFPAGLACGNGPPQRGSGARHRGSPHRGGYGRAIQPVTSAGAVSTTLCYAATCGKATGLRCPAWSTARRPNWTLSLEMSSVTRGDVADVDHVGPVRRGRLPRHDLVPGQVRLGVGVPGERGEVGAGQGAAAASCGSAGSWACRARWPGPTAPPRSPWRPGRRSRSPRTRSGRRTARR